MGCLWSCEETGNVPYGFANYRCPCCGHQWDSRKARLNVKQGCIKCDVYCKRHATSHCSKSLTYPTGWRPLTAEEMEPCDYPEKKAHKQALCEMCKAGHYCGAVQKGRKSQVGQSSRPRYIPPKRTSYPRRPPSYNAAMGHQKKFSHKRFKKY